MQMSSVKSTRCQRKTPQTRLQGDRVFVCSLARTDNASYDLMALRRLIAFVNRAVVIRVGYAVGYGGDHTQCLYA